MKNLVLSGRGSYKGKCILLCERAEYFRSDWGGIEESRKNYFRQSQMVTAIIYLEDR